MMANPMTQNHCNDAAKRYFLDYQRAFAQSSLADAKVARVGAAMAYVTHKKEDPLDFDALAISVAMNIQRDILCLPYRDPKYLYYTKTIATLLATSEHLSHALYSVLFFHSSNDQKPLRSTLHRCLDLIEIYPQPLYSRMQLNEVLAILSQEPHPHQGLIPYRETLTSDLFDLALHFFKND